MKAISILKKLINIYFYLLVIGVSATIIYTPFRLINGKMDNVHIIGFSDYDISQLRDGMFLTMLIVLLFLYYFFIKTIFLLKNCLNDLSDGNYFSDLIIKSFKKIGRLSIICGFGFSIHQFLLRFIFDNEMRLVLSNTFMISIIIGLFFMFLSEAFAQAKQTKEENELTI